MYIIAIAAMSENRVLWNQGKIPWKIPEEQQFFKQETLGSPIIMGRKTFESIGRCLPWRRNIVLSRRPFFLEKNNQPAPEVFSDIHDLIAQLVADGEERCYICGWSEIYALFFEQNLVDTVILSCVPWEYVGDAFFPLFEPSFHETRAEDHENFTVKWFDKNTDSELQNRESSYNTHT